MGPTDTCACDQNGNKCYCHYTSKVSRPAAATACEASGAYLVIVNDQAEHDYLMSVVYVWLVFCSARQFRPLPANMV